jgi:hypothetical protein
MGQAVKKVSGSTEMSGSEQLTGGGVFGHFDFGGGE